MTTKPSEANPNDLLEGLLCALRRPASILAIVMVLILGYTAITRLESLGRKPYHHDESIHALHSYNYYKGEGWKYDPVYHGPVVYFFNAVSYFLVGDSNYTGRLMPALFGILLVVMALSLSRELGGLEGLYAGALIALSPTLYYFSRFLRDDTYGACWTVMMILGYLRYRKLKDPRWLYLTTFGMAMAFCSKINALIMGFTVCSSLILYAAWYIVDGKGSAPAGSTPASRLRQLAVEHQLIVRLLWIFGGVVLTIAYYVMRMCPDYPAPGPVKPVYWISCLGVVIVGLIVIDTILEAWRKQMRLPAFADGVYDRNRPLVLYTLFFMAIFSALYTNFFKLVPLPGGQQGVSVGKLLVSGVLDGLHYWWGQQNHPRIADVWYYYVPRLLVYELPLCILVVFGSFVRLSDLQRGVLIVGLLFLVGADSMGWNVGPSAEELKVSGYTFMELALFAGLGLMCLFLGWQDLRQGRPERALLIYWSVTAFIFYAKANEKVPWLNVHVVLPLTFYGASLLADLHRELKAYGTKAVRWVYAGLGAISLAYYLHAGVILNVYSEADPKEIMVYVQSTTDVLDVVDEMERIAYENGTYYNTHFTIEDEASWPLSWYMRKYKNIGHPANITDLDSETAAVLTRSPPSDQSRSLLENNGFEGTRYRLRAWWQPNWELEVDKGKAGQEGYNKDGQESYKHYFAKMLRYVLYRDIYPPDTGSTDFMLYRRVNTVVVPGGEGNPGPGLVDKCVLPSNVVAQNILNPQILPVNVGSAPLREPRGVAVGPDSTAYVVDTVNDRVIRYSASGEVLGAFGGTGSGEGQFKQPGGIAVDQRGFVYVADTWNHRIQKFTADGKFLLQWGKEPDFYGPRGVAVANNGLVLITDTGHHKVVVYNENGQYVREWGLKGTRPRQFTEPVGITQGTDGLVYVADTGNKRIQAFDIEGKLVNSFPITGWDYIYSEPYLAMDSQQRLWLTDSKFNRIQAYTTRGCFLVALGSSMQGPIGIATGPDGSLYVSDTANNRVIKANLSTQSIPSGP